MARERAMRSTARGAGLCLVLGSACAASPDKAEANGPDPKELAAAQAASLAPISDNCLPPEDSTRIPFATFELELCPKEQSVPIAVRSEAEYLATLACAAADGAPIPSGIDWSRFELVGLRIGYAGTPGNLVAAYDSGEGRQVQLQTFAHCEGAQPMPGEAKYGLLMPVGGGDSATLIRCKQASCGWGGMTPPA